MKLAVFAVILGLCLVAASAIDSPPAVDSAEDDFDLDVVFVPEDMEADELDTFWWWFTNAFKKLLKKTLRTLKGVNCSIQAVINIRNAAYQFPIDIQTCGAQVNKQLQNVINSVNSVISTCNDIINMNENVCNNGNYNAETDANKQSSKLCLTKMVKKMYTLKQQVSKTVSLIKKVPSGADQAAVCAKTACSDLAAVFTQFPSFIQQCSRLTS